MVAGFVVKKTGWVYADPTVSALIAVFILYTAWGIVRESVSILLEATPKGLDLDKMVEAMQQIPRVEGGHDIHAWTVSDGMQYVSCHVELPKGSSIEEASLCINQLNELLAHEFNISHATIQCEVPGTCHAEHTTVPLFCDESSVKHAH